MNVHLDASEEKREKCEAALLEALSQIKILQEDKEVQEGNYKLQLSTMSEHLANMNEKLIQQTEEIQQLKFELSNKVNMNIIVILNEEQSVFITLNYNVIRKFKLTNEFMIIICRMVKEENPNYHINDQTHSMV